MVGSQKKQTYDLALWMHFCRKDHVTRVQGSGKRKPQPKGMSRKRLVMHVLPPPQISLHLLIVIAFNYQRNYLLFYYYN